MLINWQPWWRVKPYIYVNYHFVFYCNRFICIFILKSIHVLSTLCLTNPAVLRGFISFCFFYCNSFVDSLFGIAERFAETYFCHCPKVCKRLDNFNVQQTRSDKLVIRNNFVPINGLRLSCLSLDFFITKNLMFSHAWNCLFILFPISLKVYLFQKFKKFLWDVFAWIYFE